MKHSISEEDFEVPSEMEETQSITKNAQHSPKTKTSKLWLDKGFVKENDPLFDNLNLIKKSTTQRVIRGNISAVSPNRQENNYKSNMNIACEEDSLKVSFCEFMDKMGLQGHKISTGRRIEYKRNRIQSFNDGEFKLVPLLRKVSWDPTCTKESNIENKHKRKVSFFNEIESEDEQEDSVSNENSASNFVVTIGDVSPGR